MSQLSDYQLTGIDDPTGIEKTEPRLQFVGIVRRPIPRQRPCHGSSEQPTTKNWSAT